MKSREEHTWSNRTWIYIGCQAYPKVLSNNQVQLLWTNTDPLAQARSTWMTLRKLPIASIIIHTWWVQWPMNSGNQARVQLLLTLQVLNPRGRIQWWSMNMVRGLWHRNYLTLQRRRWGVRWLYKSFQKSNDYQSQDLPDFAASSYEWFLDEWHNFV